MKALLPLIAGSLILCLFVASDLHAQTAANSEQVNALAQLQDVYNRKLGAQSALYNGPQYYFYNATSLKGTPYYQANTTSTGNVHYDGLLYANVRLFYDLYKDQLVTYSYDNTPFILLSGNVRYFDLLGHHFISIDADTLSKDPAIKSGYYEELYNGGVQALAKTTLITKEVLSSIGTPEAYSTFTPPATTYYLKKGRSYYRITGEGAIYDALKDQKKKLQAFVRSNKIKYKNDPAQALAAIAAYYDSLFK